MQDRAGDVVRQVGDDVVRRRRRGRSGPGRARRPPRAAAPGLERVGEPVAQERRQPAVELDRGDRGAGVAAARPSAARAPARSRGSPPAGSGVASARIAVEHVDVGEEVLRQRVAGPQAGLAERPADGAPGRAGVAATRLGAAPLTRHRERQRRPRVEVEAGPLAGREPARRRRPRSSPRCRCTAPAAARSAGCRGPRPRPPGGSRRTRFAATPPPSTIDRAPIASRRPDRLGHEHVDDRRPGSPRRAPPAAASRERHVRRRPAQALVRAARPSTIASRRCLEPAEAEVVGVAEPGPREDRVARSSRAAAACDDRRAARIAEPEQPADLVEGLAGRVVDGLAEQPVRQVVAHLDEERVAARHDERDEREDRLRARPAASGSRSHAA